MGYFLKAASKLHNIVQLKGSTIFTEYNCVLNKFKPILTRDPGFTV